MLFDTVAEYDAEILEVRGYLKKAMVEQATVGGGPSQGSHLQRGRVQEIQDYLDTLSKEREILKQREGGGTVNRVIFGSED